MALPITTCDTSINYKVIDTLFAIDSHKESFFGAAADPSKAFEGVKNQLRQQCTELGGDAIISCQFEYRNAVHDGFAGAKQIIEIFAYGTAVKFTW